MRAFRYLPLKLKFSPVMAKLKALEQLCVLYGCLTNDDRHCLPYDAAALRSEIFPCQPHVGLRQIADARDKLVAQGVWIRKQSPRKDWLEIAPDYRHTEGQRETSYGEEEIVPIQGELGFPPVVLPSPPPSRPNKSMGREQKQESKRKTDSDDSEFAKKKAEIRFARDAGAFRDDEKWALLVRTLGYREMQAAGALWAKRFTLCRDAIVTGLSDFLAMPEADRRKWNPAAYLTAAFENWKRRQRDVASI